MQLEILQSTFHLNASNSRILAAIRQALGLGFWGLLLLVLLMYGCAPTGGAVADATEESRLQGDKDLPPPLDLSNQTPDLQNAYLEVSENALNRLREDGADDSIVVQAQGLSAQRFFNAETMRKALLIKSPNFPEGWIDPLLQASLVIVELSAAAAPGSVRAVRGPASRPGDYGTRGYVPVFFEVDSAVVRAKSSRNITKNVKKLLKNSNLRVTLEGHSDERGSNDYNLALGHRRARLVRDAMISKGLPSNRIRTVSFGEERPVELGGTLAAWSSNRRVVFRVR